MEEFDPEFIDHIGIHPQKQAGIYYIGLSILGGRIKAEEMQVIAELSENRHRESDLRKDGAIFDLSPVYWTPFALIENTDVADIRRIGNIF